MNVTNLKTHPVLLLQLNTKGINTSSSKLNFYKITNTSPGHKKIQPAAYH